MKSKRKQNLYSRVRQILEATRNGLARTVNTTQVIANWLVGREIVEEEQKGKRRAGYGERVLADLAERLLADFGAGYSVSKPAVYAAVLPGVSLAPSSTPN